MRRTFIYYNIKIFINLFDKKGNYNGNTKNNASNGT